MGQQAGAGCGWEKAWGTGRRWEGHKGEAQQRTTEVPNKQAKQEEGCGGGGNPGEKVCMLGMGKACPQVIRHTSTQGELHRWYNKKVEGAGYGVGSKEAISCCSRWSTRYKGPIPGTSLGKQWEGPEGMVLVVNNRTHNTIQRRTKNPEDKQWHSTKGNTKVGQVQGNNHTVQGVCPQIRQ